MSPAGTQWEGIRVWGWLSRRADGTGRPLHAQRGAETKNIQREAGGPRVSEKLTTEQQRSLSANFIFFLFNNYLL